MSNGHLVRRRRPVGAVLAGVLGWTLLATILSGCTGGNGDRTASPGEPRPHQARITPPPPGPEPGRTGPDHPGAGPYGSGLRDCPRTVGRIDVSPTEQERLDARLIAATWGRDAATARRLVCRGADVNAKDATEQSAYLMTTSEGQPALLDFMLGHGADVDSLDSYDGTGLIRAAERGHLLVVGRLLQEPIAVDHVNNLGWTALLEAVVLGDGSRRYVDTVRALVAGAADVSIPATDDGLTPRQHAAARGQEAVARTLLRAEAADRAPRAGQAVADTALLRAAAAGDADGVAVALRQGAALEARDHRRRTALLLAALNDQLAVARLLVALGADPNAQDLRRDSPWLVTGVTGSVAMLEVLLPAEPDLGLRNRYGGVSLIPAAERGHVGYVRRVVRTGIDVDHVNDLGWTALLEAVILGDGSRPYQQIVRVLLEAGADTGISDRDGVTALEHARAGGQTAVARILTRADRPIDAGAG